MRREEGGERGHRDSEYVVIHYTGKDAVYLG